MQVYTYSKATKIAFYLLVVILTITALGSIAFGIHDWLVNSKPAMLFFVAIGLLLLVLSIFAANDITATLSIDQYSIKYQSKFYSREIALTDIKGYRVNTKNKSIYVFSIVPGQKKVTVSPYLKGLNDIQQYFADNYTDLDYEEGEEEYQKVVDNLGEAGEVRIKKAKTTMYTCNAVIISLAVLAGLFTSSYPWLPLALFSTILLLFGAMYYHKGIYRVVDSKSNRVPAVMIPFMAIAIGIFFATLHSHIIGYGEVFKTTAVITLPILAIFLFLSKKAIGKDKSLIIGAPLLYLLLIGGSAYGFVLCANRYFDKDSVTIHTTQISKKRISSGSKSKTYYVELQPWGPVAETDEESVTASFYYRVNPPQDISIFLHNGFLGIPWYMMEGEE